uniref:Pentapeptide repeat-containing protein n=1 Tax=Odontella aurita TaxID=265563 RepID=A0A7S4HSI0_9STRA
MRINSTPGAALLCLAALTTAAAAFNPSSIRHGDFANASKRKSEGAPRIALSMGSLCEDPIALKAKSAAASVFAALSIAAAVAFSPPAAIAADDTGASTAANAKITTGGASTLQSGRTIAITRGVNLDRSDFGGQNLKGVAFQQSIVRDSNFKGCNLVGSSFFDATVDGSDFEGADLTLANFEMAQFNRANLKVSVRCSLSLVVAFYQLFPGEPAISWHFK